MLRTGTLTGTCVLGVALLVFAQQPQAPPQESPRGDDVKKNEPPSMASVRKALRERVDVPEEFKNPIAFRAVVKHIDDILRARKQSLDIVINHAAIRQETPDANDVLEQQVTFPPFQRTMTVQQMLDEALSQMPMGGVTFLVRNGRVDITTDRCAAIPFLLDQGVSLTIRDVPVQQAIEELSDVSGVTIVVDRRCGMDLVKSVSLNAHNDISVRGALLSWADMFDWKLIADEHRVLLMPRADYMKKIRDLAEESKLLNDMPGMLIDMPPPPPPGRQRGLRNHDAAQ